VSTHCPAKEILSPKTASTSAATNTTATAETTATQGKDQAKEKSSEGPSVEDLHTIVAEHESSIKTNIGKISCLRECESGKGFFLQFMPENIMPLLKSTTKYQIMQTRLIKN